MAPAADKSSTDQQAFTMQQRCEAISRWQTARGNPMSADRVWNSAPGAELWPIFDLYEQAKAAGFPAEVKAH